MIRLPRATSEVAVRAARRDLGAAGTDFITLKSMTVAPGRPKEAPDPFSKSERLVSLLLERVRSFPMEGDLRRPVRRPGRLTGRLSVNGDLHGFSVYAAKDELQRSQHPR